MLTLYYMPTCPFCQRVLKLAENLNVKLTLKDVTDDDIAMAEMMSKGGDGEVPFLIDTEKGNVIDESNDIIEYLRENYAQKGSDKVINTKPRMHIGGAVCESCEG